MTNVNSADKKPEKYVKPNGKVGIRMVPVDKEVVKNEAYNEPQGQAKRMMSPLQKARMDKEKADRDRDGKLKPGVVKRGKSTMNRLKDIRQRADAFAVKSRKEEVEQVDEVLDRPGALDSYRKKADDSGNRARNSATRKILTAPKDGKRPDHSDELKTMRKRNKGQDMADRVAARQFRKSIGQPYIKKEEVEQLDELSPRTKASYLKKASAQNKKVQKAYDKSVKSSPDAYFGDDSPEDQKRAKTMDKRQKGMAMAKGRKYGQKYESVEEKKALTMKQMRRALQSIKPSKKKPTLPKAPWDKKDD